MYIAHSVKHGKVGAERTHMGWGQGDAIHGGLRLMGVRVMGQVWKSIDPLTQRRERGVGIL